MSEIENAVGGEKKYPRLVKFITSLSWLLLSIVLVGGGNYLWYKFDPGYGPDKALIGAALSFWLVMGFTIWAAKVTKSADVAREGVAVIFIAFLVAFIVAYVGGAVVYGRYEYARDVAQYAEKFTGERCALRGCTRTDDAGVVEIDALQDILDEQDAVKKAYTNLDRLKNEATELDETVVGVERKAAVTKSFQDIEDALKGRKRDDYWLLRSVVNFSPLVCEAGNQHAVGAHVPGGVAPSSGAAVKTGLVCRPQVMLDYGKGLPEAYPLWTWVLDKMGLLPIRAG